LEALVPILVRPVREQLEHDRIIRLLEAKWRRKFAVGANPGDERNAGVKGPAGMVYPDLVLTEEGGRKPKALIEVETSESVNHLEAMSQWANLAKARTSLLLFVPAGAVEAARRLASENAIKIAEMWTYLVLGDQVRFTSVFRDGSEPADLIEKGDVFTTERAAPVPRPVPAEVVEPAPAIAKPAAEPERPRKLAVKAGSKPAVAGRPAPVTAPPAPAKPGPVAKAAPVAPSAAAVKATPVAKAVPPPPAAAPGKPSKTAGAGKVEPAKAAAAPKPVPAAAARAARPIAKPAADKPADKPGHKKPEKAAKKAVARKAEKKAAPKLATPARKAVAPKAIARAVAKKAVPPRPAVRTAKKAAPAKLPRTASKRK
jgi:hypothetical protein